MLPSLRTEETNKERDRRNQVKPSVNLRMLAKNALNPIEKKLKGIYSTSKEKPEKEISTSNLVQMLIQEATDPLNLVCGCTISRTKLTAIASGQDVSWMGGLALTHIINHTGSIATIVLPQCMY